MALKLRMDERALRDLVAIRAYIAEHNPAAAERVRRHIETAIDRLLTFPKLGRVTENPSIRVWPLTRYPYLVFYTVGGEALTVLHIRHSARAPLDTREL